MKLSFVSKNNFNNNNFKAQRKLFSFHLKFNFFNKNYYSFTKNKAKKETKWMQY
jgi:hypothetical protein